MNTRPGPALDPFTSTFVEGIARGGEPRDAFIALSIARSPHVFDVAERALDERGDVEMLCSATLLANGDARWRVERALGVLFETNDDIVDAGVTELRRLMIAASDVFNGRPSGSVQDRALERWLTRLRDSALDVDDIRSPPARVPALAQLAAATFASDPAACARLLYDRGDRNARIAACALDLFVTGRPERALSAAGAPTAVDAPDRVTTIWVEWLAAAQCGELEAQVVRWRARRSAVESHVAEEFERAIESAMVVLGSGGGGGPGERGGPTESVSIDVPRSPPHRSTEQISGAWRAASGASRAVTDEPRVATTVDRGRAELQRGGWDAAARSFAKAADQAKRSTQQARLLLAAARAVALSGSAAYAVRYAAAACECARGDVEIVADALRIHVETESAQLSACVEAVIRSLEAPPLDSECEQHLAFAAEALARAGESPERIRAALAQAADTAPSTTHRWLALAGWCARTADFAGAASAVEEAGRTERDRAARARLYVRAADIYIDRLGMRLPALENCLVAFTCAPDESATLERLERLCTDLGRFRDLASAYGIAAERARARPEDAANLFYRKARLELTRLQCPDDAARSIAEAIRIRPDDPRFAALLTQEITRHLPEASMPGSTTPTDAGASTGGR